jgi:hypothetical protein
MVPGRILKNCVREYFFSNKRQEWKSTIRSLVLHSLSVGEESLYISTRLPFRVFDLDEVLKYLSFQLKPNDYQKTDWRWLIAKLEKRLKCWSHRWLSRVGRLVLVKEFLEAIPIYWMSLAWIPKGILEKMRKL